MDHGTAAAIDRIITLKTNRRLAILKLKQASAKQLASIFRKNKCVHYDDQCLWYIGISHNSVINFDTHLNPKVILVGIL